MPEELLIAVLLAAVAVTFWRPLRRVRALFGIDHLVSTGHVFILLGYGIGWLLGTRLPNIVSDLDPVVAFVSGWVGFASGIRFDRRVLRTVPARAYAVALAPAVAAAAAVGIASWGLLLTTGAGVYQAAAASLILAAVAAGSGTTLPAIARTRRAGRRSSTRGTLRMVETARVRTVLPLDHSSSMASSSPGLWPRADLRRGPSRPRGWCPAPRGARAGRRPASTDDLALPRASARSRGRHRPALERAEDRGRQRLGVAWRQAALKSSPLEPDRLDPRHLCMLRGRSQEPRQLRHPHPPRRRRLL